MDFCLLLEIWGKKIGRNISKVELLIKLWKSQEICHRKIQKQLNVKQKKTRFDKEISEERHLSQEKRQQTINDLTSVKLWQYYRYEPHATLTDS